jgi:hypothetical protein
VCHRAKDDPNTGFAEKSQQASLLFVPTVSSNVNSLALTCVLLGVLSSVSHGNPAEDNRLSPEGLLRPVKLVSTSGNIQNAEALVEDHQGFATLTMTAGGAAPMVILDYGRDVGGIPVFEVMPYPGLRNYKLSTANRSSICCPPVTVTRPQEFRSWATAALVTLRAPILTPSRAPASSVTGSSRAASGSRLGRALSPATPRERPRLSVRSGATCKRVSPSIAAEPGSG